MHNIDTPPFYMPNMFNMSKNMHYMNTPPYGFKIRKIISNMHLKTGLPPGGRPVLRFFY